MVNYRDIRAQSKLLQDVAGYSADVIVMETKDRSQRIVAPRVTTNLFSMLGVQPLLGRTFDHAEGQTAGPDVALLSEDLWRQSFHADPAIVGHTVKIGGELRTIVGVMPDRFRFPESAGPAVRNGVWLPLQPTREMLTNRGYHFFNIVGELRPGVNIVQFQHELDAIAARIRQTDTGNTIAFQCHALPGSSHGTGAPGSLLSFRSAGAGAADRLRQRFKPAHREKRQSSTGIRCARGAWSRQNSPCSPSTLEGLTLSLFGCGVGVLLAEAMLVAVRKLPEGTVPRADFIAIHWTVVLVLATIAIVTTVLSSLLPALLVARADPQAALQSATRGIGSRSVKGRFSGWLVAGEVALSALLLVGTGLLFHTLWNLEKSQLGFDSEHLITFTAMSADAAGFSNMSASADAQNAAVSVATITYQPVLERIRHVPGVASAALITAPPLSNAGVQSNFEIIGQPTDSRDQAAPSPQSAATMPAPWALRYCVDEWSMTEMFGQLRLSRSLTRPSPGNTLQVRTRLVKRSIWVAWMLG